MNRFITLAALCLLLAGLAFADTPGTSGPFFDAIRHNQLATVKQLLAQQPALLNTPDEQGKPPVVVAMESHQVEIAKYLIAQGADVKVVLPKAPHPTLLHIAAQEGEVELLALLVQKGLDVNARADMKLTPLHVACAPEGNTTKDAARWLLEHGANPNAAIDASAAQMMGVKEMGDQPWFGTPMMFAVIRDSMQPGLGLEQLLLKYHATPIPPEARAKMLREMLNAHARAEQAACLANLRALANACVICAQEHQERFPSAETVWKDLADYVHVTRCPDAPKPSDGYGYNALLAGKSMVDIPSPHTTIMFADCKSADNLIHSMDDIDQQRHGDGFVAAFVDGHVELIKAGTKVQLAP